MAPQLPVELLHFIFQDATQESLRNFRLVNLQWNTASTPYVFERVHTSLFSRSLTKLSALSLSPLAKHVKAIDFHTDQLTAYSRQEWESKIDLRPGLKTYRGTLEGNIDHLQVAREYEQLPRHDYTPAQLEEGWRVYQTYRSEQHHWNDGQGSLVLKECICRLKNLREVVADRAKPFRGPVNDQPFWRNFMTEILLGPDAWTYDQNRHDYLEALATLLVVTAVGHRSSIAGTKTVEKLALDLPKDYSFHDMVYLPRHYPRFRTGKYSQTAEPGARYEAVLNAFRPLKHLTLRCPGVEAHMTPARRSQVEEVSQILTAAVGLHTLDLDFGEPFRFHEGIDEDANQYDYGLISLLSRRTITYPHLTELRISASFLAKLFAPFLILHRKTLKGLDMRDCFCDDWETVFMTIARVLKQDHLYLESLWSPGTGDDIIEEDPDLLFGEGLNADDEFTQDMRAFLHTGEGPMPRIQEYAPDSDDGHDETLYETIAGDNFLGHDEEDEWSD